MRVLALDPGFDRLGIAVLERDSGGMETILHSDCFETRREDDFSIRLKTIGVEVRRLLQTFNPDIVALELLFFSANKKTAMRVAEVRGAILLCAAEHDVPVREYGPGEIKIAITGYGKSDKGQVAAMVQTLLHMNTSRAVRDDEYDAIAVGLTCLARERQGYQ